MNQQLNKYKISTPPYALVNRDYPDQDLDYFKEEEDYVEVRGKKIMKPFVEKPVDGAFLLSQLFLPAFPITFGEAVFLLPHEMKRTKRSFLSGCMRN